MPSYLQYHSTYIILVLPVSSFYDSISSALILVTFQIHFHWNEAVDIVDVMHSSYAKPAQSCLYWPSFCAYSIGAMLISGI